MYILVTYDVNTEEKEGKKRLYRVAKMCKDYGCRVQNSVFECNVNPAQWIQLRAELERIFDPTTDSLRYYNLGDNYSKHIEHVGAKIALDVEKPIVI